MRFTVFIIVGLMCWVQSATAQMSVKETPADVVVSSAGSPSWSVTFDLTKGGVVTEMHLSGGPNLIANGNSFTGLFNVFSTDHREGNPYASKSGAFLKNTIRGQGKVESAKVLERGPGRIVLELKGWNTGRFMPPPEGGKVLDFRQTFTLEPHRILCDGEIIWVYGDHTRPREVAVISYFVPDSIAFPLRFAGADGNWRDLPLTPSEGAVFPEGVKHPVTTEVFFRDGQRVLFRSEKEPAPWQACPWYKYERPWQTDWQPMFGFTAHSDIKCDTAYTAQQPVAYRYALEIPGGHPANTPPVLRIVKPIRGLVKDLSDVELYSGLRFKPGDVIEFEATAIDKEDGELSGSEIVWNVYPKSPTPIATGKGKIFRFKLPETKQPMWWVSAERRDSKGLLGIDYITFNADVPVKAAVDK